MHERKNYLDSRTSLKVFALNCLKKFENPEYIFFAIFLFNLNRPIFYYAKIHLHEWIRQQALLFLHE